MLILPKNIMNLINPSSEPSSFYGCCIRTHDDLLIVGARCGSPYDPVGPGFVEIFKDGKLIQTLHGKKHGERFGVSIEVNDKYLCIGAYREGTRARNGGSVYVYTRKNDWYIFDHIVVGYDKTEDDYFGYNISLDDKYLAVGAYAKDYIGGEDGKVYLYNLDQRTCNNIFVNTAPVKDENFGRFVHLDNENLYVSAHKQNKVFVYNDSIFSHVLSPEGAKGFGNSIYTYKDYVIIGAYSTDDVGAVYIYKNNTLIDTLKGNTKNGYFGGSISGYKGNILIGCYRANKNENGSIFLYNLKTKKLVEYTNPEDSKKHWFGYSVYIDKQNFYVGAVQYNDTGAVYQFPLSNL